MVISPPDTREGHQYVDQASLPEVRQRGKDNVGNTSNAQECEREVIERFDSDDAPELLIDYRGIFEELDTSWTNYAAVTSPYSRHR